MPDILEVKESSAIPPIVLLAVVRDNQGEMRYWSTVNGTDSGHTYEPRLLWESPNSWKLAGDPTVEGSGSITLMVANADGAIAQLNREGVLNGAEIQLYAATLNGTVVDSKTPVWNGLLSGVSSLDDRVARLVVINRLSAMRTSFPPLRIQKTCAWAFPKNAAERQFALSGGEDGRYSPLFRCGYSPGLEGGVGNLDGAGLPFTSCDFTRRSCEERGMFGKDYLNHTTQRFSGIEYVPPSVLVRGYGESSGRLSNLVQLEAKFNDVIPIVYGAGWLTAPVVFSRNDGNLTHAEVLLGLGQIESVLKVVVNGYEIPQGIDGKNMTSTGWYNLANFGNRTGAFNLDFTNSTGIPQGDPYASMAVLSVVVPNAISTGKTAPKVEVLMKGVQVPVLDADGNLVEERWTKNPAWIICDILRRCGWRLNEIDLPSVIAAANYCDQPVAGLDFDGNAVQVPRFEINLVLTRKYSLGELLRSIRYASLLQLRFSPEGKLALRAETTIAGSQPSPLTGSNATESVLGGWPVYEFGDGIDGPGGILLKSSGEADFRMFSKESADSANRVNFEFQDEMNEFRQESISVADHDDIQARRQEIVQNLPVLGVPNQLQAQRVCQSWLNKSLAGNVFMELRTSFRGMHIRPGDLVAVTFAKYGLDRALFRVLEVELDSLLRWVRVTGQLHQDYWYSDSAETRYDTLRRYAWNNSRPRSVVGTTVVSGKVEFAPSEALLVREDGTRAAALTIPFVKPGSSAGCLVSIPRVTFDYDVLNGGILPANENFFYQVTAVDANGIESTPSSMIPVRTGTGSGTCSVRLKGLSFSPATASMHIYRGHTPSQLVRVASAIPVAAQWTDTGAAEIAAVAPDSEFRGIRSYWRQVLLAPFQAQSFGSQNVGRSDLNLVVDRWKGKTLTITTGPGIGQERSIVGNSATSIQFDRPWTVTPDATSRFSIVEAGWNRGADSDTGVVVVELPLWGGETFEVNLRSLTGDGVEQSPIESPIIRWQLGVGSGSGTDLGVPAKPEFSFQMRSDGTLVVSAISFQAPANLKTIYAGKLGVYFWDELQSPGTLTLDVDLAAGGTQLSLASLGGFVEGGRILQIAQELLEVTSVDSTAGTVTVARGRFGTTGVLHTAGTSLFRLDKKEHLVPFVEGYFTASAASEYEYSFRMPNVRIAAADLILYNRLGGSPVAEANLTVLLDQGFRTLTGGQINLTVDGYLSIQGGAGSFAVADRALVVGDVFATVREAPQGGDVSLILRIDDTAYCTLTVPAGHFTSSTFSGFNLAPIAEGSRISFDIVGVPSAAVGTPGRDLSLLIEV